MYTPVKFLQGTPEFNIVFLSPEILVRTQIWDRTVNGQPTRTRLVRFGLEIKEVNILPLLLVINCPVVLLVSVK